MNKYQIGDAGWFIEFNKDFHIVLNKLLVFKIEYIYRLDDMIDKVANPRAIRYKGLVVEVNGEPIEFTTGNQRTILTSEDKLYKSKELAIKTYEDMIKGLK